MKQRIFFWNLSIYFHFLTERWCTPWRYFTRGSAGISRRKFRNLTGNFTRKSRTFVAFWVLWTANDRKKPLIFNVHWIDISLVHHFICNREQWLIITVSSPSYRPYKQENTNGYFDISRKWMSKPGNMEAFLPGNLPESEEVYRIFKNIRLQNIIYSKV